MKKNININGEKVQVEYNVIDSVLVEDNSKPSKKYIGIKAIDESFKFIFSIGDKVFETKKRFTQDGGCYSEKWLSNDGVWVNSEKKLIESFYKNLL